MNWIKEVKTQLLELDYSRKNLRKFGITVGLILVMLAIFIFFRYQWIPKEITTRSILWTFILISGILLILIGVVFPNNLRNIFKLWMIFGLTIGFYTSSLILSLLFYIVITPIGLFAKIVGKDFLNADFGKKQVSYWISKEKKINSSYEKLY